MGLALTFSNSFEFSLSRSGLYLEAFGFEFFATASEDWAPVWGYSRWEVGSGRQIILGPVTIEAGRVR